MTLDPRIKGFGHAAMQYDLQEPDYQDLEQTENDLNCKADEMMDREGDR